MIDLNDLAASVNREVGRRWPAMNTVQSEALALFEEGGEVARAILKRDEGTRGTPEGWTKGLRKEIGQTFLVLLNIAHLEGIDVETLIRHAWADLIEKPDREAEPGHASAHLEPTVEAAPETQGDLHHQTYKANGRPVCGDPAHRHSGPCSFWAYARERDAAIEIERANRGVG